MITAAKRWMKWTCLPNRPSSPTPTPMGDMVGMDHGKMGHDGMEMGQMRSTIDLLDPMSRESSGTAWNPDSSPVYAKMRMFKDGGMLMFMGNAFVRYTNVGSSRDVSVAGKGSTQSRRCSVDVYGDVFAPDRREFTVRVSCDGES